MMHRFSCWSAVWVTTVSLVISAQSAMGQPLIRGFESLEWMVASSDLVLRGTLANITTEHEDDDTKWHTVEFKVAETLKGTPQQTVSFVVEGSGRNELVRWHELQRPLVVFLRDSRRMASVMAGSSGLSGRKYLRFPYAVRSGHCERSIVELGDDRRVPAYSLAFERGREPEEILPVLKQAARFEVPANSYSCTVSIPRSGGLDLLTVPVDARLEVAAQQWAKSKEMDAREAAVVALQYFQSATNVDVLKGLLNDPGAYTLEVSDGGALQKKECRYFPVRRSAYQVLQAWGIDVPRPVDKEPLP